MPRMRISVLVITLFAILYVWPYFYGRASFAAPWVNSFLAVLKWENKVLIEIVYKKNSTFKGMAGVISISSDEEDVASEGNCKKKIKLYVHNNKKEESSLNGNVNGSIIILDDEDDHFINLRKLKKTIQNDFVLRKVDQVKLPKCSKSHKLEDGKMESNLSNFENNCRTAVNNVSSDEDLPVIDKVSMLEDAAPVAATNKSDVSDSILETGKLTEDVENTKEDKMKLENGYNESSSSIPNNNKVFENCKPMQDLINLCLDCIKSEETRSLFKSKIPLCKRVFVKVGEQYTKSDEFTKELEAKINLSKNNSFMAIQCFNDIYYLLKAQKTYSVSDGGGATNTKNESSKITRKLEHALKKLRKRIRQLESEEIDFSNEEDSCYIQLNRYNKRAVKIYEKLCKYNNEDPYYNSIMHNRLDFSGSKLPEINKAINRKFKNNLVFPTYYDIEQCVKRCLDTNNITMSKAEFKAEVRQCFEKLGNLIQHRRKVDLLGVHSYYVPSNLDPADEDPELNQKLLLNKQVARVKIDDIIEKYSRLQETGENPQLSSDSDDSIQILSDDD